MILYRYFLLGLIILGYSQCDFFDTKEKWYSEQEEIDAKKVLQIKNDLTVGNIKWDSISVELEKILKNIPDVYVTSFEDGGRKYVKFWDQNEFDEYKSVYGDNVEYLQDAYTLASYLIAIAKIETGNFESALDYLNRGLDLDSLNPGLLNEMGMLFTRVAGASVDTSYYHVSNYYFSKAFNSRMYVTKGQKARALRGIGYNLIDLKKYDHAKKYYAESLEYEESRLALDEIELIEIKLLNDSVHVFEGSTNFNENEDVRSSAYFQEKKEKLSKEIQDSISSSYIYIREKASFFVSKNIDEYRKNDYWNYPLKDWNINEIKRGMHQIAYYLKGVSPDYSIRIKDVESAKQVLLTLHYEFIGEQSEVMGNNEKALRLGFKHRVNDDTVYLYFNVDGA